MDDRSLEEAEAFGMSIERPESRGMAIQGIYNRWTKQDPVAAATSVDNLSDPTLKDYAIRGMIQQSAGGSPEVTLAWTMTMQEGEVRTNAVKFLAGRWRSEENQEVFEKLIEHPLLTKQERNVIRQSTEE